jgi:hypothetical protein
VVATNELEKLTLTPVVFELKEGPTSPPSRKVNLPVERHGLSRTPEYKIWDAIKTRTKNPNHPQYADYTTICQKVNIRMILFMKWLWLW